VASLSLWHRRRTPVASPNMRRKSLRRVSMGVSAGDHV
jgi:hypothetical protein